MQLIDYQTIIKKGKFKKLKCLNKHFKKEYQLGIKKGKLTASHRYNFIPLLRSRPGGLKGAGRTGLTQAQK